MKVIVACEYSGKVRDAFIAQGHDAMSCDLLPTDSPGPHYQGDIRDIDLSQYDLMVAHPPCTYLTNSGVRWLEGNSERWEQMISAREFFAYLLNAPVEHIAVENPIPHGHAKLPPHSQIIHPWQYGHGETKATCLWLKNLPLLYPTNIVQGREQRLHKLPPTEDRWKIRSETYQGIADAMAAQWSEPKGYQQCLV